MSHFAKIENKIVTQVIVADEDFISSCDGEWIQTSYNTYGGKHKLGGTPLRKNYAGIGYSYSPELDAFIPPKPYESWTLNNDTCLWSAPTPMPTDGKLYKWNEPTLSWIEITQE
jgi:hypothetical protein